MNKIYSLLGIGLLSAATLSSCKEDVFIEGGDELQRGESQTYVAVASIRGYENTDKESSTRANVQDDGSSFMWNADDKVTLWNGTNGYDFTTIDYSNENEPGENVEYLLEWDVNDAFYDFPFVGNSVTFEKTAPETMNVVYDEDLYQKDLEYFETILGSFSLDINSVSMDSILEHFKAGKTLCAFVNTDSLQKLDDISYSVMEIPALNEELPSIGCASTDMFIVNDFSQNTDQAADFADFGCFYFLLRYADRYFFRI